jgi:hypothetical protein
MATHGGSLLSFRRSSEASVPDVLAQVKQGKVSQGRHLAFSTNLATEPFRSEPKEIYPIPEHQKPQT